MRTTDFVDDTVRLDPELGEIQKSYSTALALQRYVGNKEQRIMIYGDGDCISNSELLMRRRGFDSSNYSIITGSFFWLSNEEVPIDVRRPTPVDNEVYLSKKAMSIWRILILWIFPGIMLFSSLFLEIRRRSR